MYVRYVLWYGVSIRDNTEFYVYLTGGRSNKYKAILLYIIIYDKLKVASGDT